jgi:hypothetical protein
MMKCMVTNYGSIFISKSWTDQMRHLL